MRNRPTFRPNDRSALRASASAPAPKLALVVVAGPVHSAHGLVLELGDAPLVIARVADADTDDDWMSREHATLRSTADGVFVRDGAAVPGGGWKPSANGTFVEARDGREREVKVVGEVQLAPRQILRTGRTLWMLVPDAQRAPASSHLVGISDALARVRDELKLLVAEVALRFDRNRRVTQSLLVTGPRGTGKQVVAHELHRMLAERRGDPKIPFVDLPAPALADGTSAADIFGVVDRYATDVKARPGFFERAHGGVLLIDEVADLPLGEQAKLLNLLEERQVTRLGGRSPIPFDCLVVAATNRDVAAMAAAGTFRADLLDRLSRFHVHLPPLDDRREDVLPLARALLERHAYDGPLTWDVALELMRQRWPGNVRDLDAFVERLVAIARGSARGVIERGHFDKAVRALQTTLSSVPAAAPSRAAAPPGDKTKASRMPTRDELMALLIGADWNKTAVARALGKHPRQITRWMDYLGIRRPGSEAQSE